MLYKYFLNNWQAEIRKMMNWRKKTGRFESTYGKTYEKAYEITYEILLKAN